MPIPPFVYEGIQTLRQPWAVCWSFPADDRCSWKMARTSTRAGGADCTMTLSADILNHRSPYKLSRLTTMLAFLCVTIIRCTIWFSHIIRTSWKMCHNCTHQERSNFVWPHSLQPRCLSRDFATKPKRSGNCVAPYKLFLSHFIVCRECHSLASVPADSSPSGSFSTRRRMLWQGSLGHSFSLP